MIRRERDSKFVIYQVLYIFVITVLALKGANIDLRRVALEEETVDKRVRDSLMAVLDSLYSLGIDFSIKIDPNVVVENVELREQLASLTQRFDQLQEQIPPPEEEPEEIIEEQTRMPLPISLKQTFIQHTWNKARNSGTVPTYIYDPRDRSKPLTTIPPGEEKTFDLTDQSEVIVAFGSQEERVKVTTNKPPDIKIERVTTKMNSREIFVQELQRITAFKVTVVDNRPDQLKITYSGPVSVSGPQKDSNGNLIYNVSLKLASTENAYDDWIDKNESLREADGRYKANFFFIAVDEKTKDRVQVGDSFFFTDFSK
jgi:hypothetical protein